MSARLFLSVPIRFAALILVAAAAAGTSPPRRVVSVNQCTDQLAILIADRGQLYSVSYLTLDPANAVLAEEAKGFVTNHGSSEEIFLMKPDLVLAGSFSNRSAVSLLRRLGFRVEEFDPVNSIDDIRHNMARMGEILGRQDRAAELIERFDREIEALTVGDSLDSSLERARRPRVAFLFPNGYTFAGGTLLDEISTLAGFTNVAADDGLEGLAQMSLESLVLSTPDLIVSGQLGGEAPALANEAMSHPVMERLFERTRHLVLDDRFWVCGGPFTIETLRVFRQVFSEMTDIETGTAESVGR